MTTIVDRYSDLLDATSDPDLVQLVSRLDTMRRGSPTPKTDLMIRQALHARTAELPETSAMRQPAPSALPFPTLRRTGDAAPARSRVQTWNHRAHARISLPIAAMIALALAFGLGSFLPGHGPAAASAATIFRRAQTAGLAANEITHFSYRVTNSGTFGGPLQIWVLANGGGRPSRLAFTPSALDPSTDYNAAPRFLVGAYEDVVGRNSPASLAGSTVVGKRTFDGALTDVVRAPSGATLYFDSRTYILLGADWTDLQQGGAQHGSNSTWRAELTQHGTVLPADAPALPWEIHFNGFTQGATTSQPEGQNGVHQQLHP